ncbi:MAG: tRNA (N(6)-L-threonylcarbamoyladenosine(37)-C(2))-methylthiotransferase MtaB [Salinivirgaceae bacterium]|jgi:threonylcarbamoyladenosine tRNA methylthiotransferase MtaB|nr:tRNA (N(6)-L-threonylcarbamoyladenosine(37)-C(2))-methylthiotransferase MtaB [Salinivirgaceae bacterium]
MIKKVSFFTLGCKLNFAETSSLAKAFENKGYERTNKLDDSDIVIVNTCSVTSLAEKKGRNILSRAKRANPNAVIVAMGCYAQLNPDELKDLGHIDLILGNDEKFNIFDYLKTPGEQKIFRHPYKEIARFDGAYSSSDRTRTFLKVQDGCDYFCAYCTIPMARGLSRSPNIDSIVKSIDEITKTGSKEIILTGVNIGDFGRKNGESFYDLLKKIIQVGQPQRLRISSIEPNLLTNEIIELAAQTPQIMPHFHIPLQCGTDEMLQKMNRRYTTDLFKQRIEKIRSVSPNAFIAADVIVGTPGETDVLHRRAMDFIAELQLSALHVFTYSQRPNTKAATMEEQVNAATKNERSKQMHELSQTLEKKFIETQLNSTHSVLFEKPQKDGYIYGFTDNYLRVKVPYTNGLDNTITNVNLRSVNNENEVNGEIL